MADLDYPLNFHDWGYAFAHIMTKVALQVSKAVDPEWRRNLCDPVEHVPITLLELTCLEASTYQKQHRHISNVHTTTSWRDYKRYFLPFFKRLKDHKRL